MRTRAACFGAGIEAGRCRYRAMPKDVTHHFVLARPRIKENFAGSMTKQMGVEAQTGVAGIPFD